MTVPEQTTERRLEPDDSRVVALLAEADAALHLYEAGQVESVLRWLLANYAVVPVSQREAEQRVIGSAKLLARLYLAGGYDLRYRHDEFGALTDALAALAVQGDTDTTTEGS